jgi:mannose-6-phosphate isomerase-like protein (cupin superfamily)
MRVLDGYRQQLYGTVRGYTAGGRIIISWAAVHAPQQGKGEMNPVNLEAKLATFSEHWQPRTVTQFNGHDIMVVKAQGEFVWHRHDETDDFFLVLKGHLTIELRDRNVQLGPGELFVVPKGVEHRPVAHEEVHLLLIEPAGTPNTGNAATAAPRRVI